MSLTAYLENVTILLESLRGMFNMHILPPGISSRVFATIRRLAGVEKELTRATQPKKTLFAWSKYKLKKRAVSAVEEGQRMEMRAYGMLFQKQTSSMQDISEYIKKHHTGKRIVVRSEMTNPAELLPTPYVVFESNSDYHSSTSSLVYSESVYSGLGQSADSDSSSE